MPRPRGHVGIARPVRLSVPWRSCLGHQRRADCGRRSAEIFAIVELPSAGGISSRRPRCDTLFELKNGKLNRPINVQFSLLLSMTKETRKTDLHTPISIFHLDWKLELSHYQQTVIMKRLSYQTRLIRTGVYEWQLNRCHRRIAGGHRQNDDCTLAWSDSYV